MTWVFLALLIFQNWQNDYSQPPVSVSNKAGGSDNNLPAVPPADAALPQAPQYDPATPQVGGTETAMTATPDAASSAVGRRIQVKTDVFNIEIDSTGGDIHVLALPAYPKIYDEPDVPITLMNNRLPHVFILQSGLLGSETGLVPNHQSVYQFSQAAYAMAEDADSLDVPLTWTNNAGIVVTKTYHFKRGSYRIDVSYTLDNQSLAAWQGRVYGQLQRNEFNDVKESSFIYTYTGGAIRSQETYQKLDFGDIEDGGSNAYLGADGEVYRSPQASWSQGWLAMMQHYFVAAVVPPAEQESAYYSKSLPAGRYVLGHYGPSTKVAVGAQQQFDFQFYAGPKIQEDMIAVAPGLELTVDFGWLWFVANPLFLLLKYLHSLFGNWGWSIIVLTILIKLAFYKLSAASYKSMANMRRIHPRLLTLKERYTDDRQGLNQAMMDLYRKEKINPLGGCLPILIQIPVFIALYWVLLESVELRQAPFMLWIQDMSSADPYFILPLLMGVTMMIQQRLNPTPLDPIQQKVMTVLPIMFTVFFAFFPAGLVLYWVVNNTLSIAQQWVITKRIAGDV